MNMRTNLMRAGLAFALALPIFTTTPPVARAAESALATRSQPDSSSVRPGPSSFSPQSVNTGPVPTATSQAGFGPTGGRTTAPDQRSDGIQVETAPDGRPARAGSLIVTFRKGAEASAQNAAHLHASSSSVETVGKGNAVRVEVEAGTLQQAMTAYAGRSDVARVEPDYLVFADGTPNDPRFGDEWGIRKVQAPAAWDRVGGGTGVRVAILDTGIASHPDLNSRVVVAKDFTTSPNGTNDVNGHGTHVAGTVAAVANNNLGVVGVAPDASLVIAKVLGDSGSGSISTVANGMIWAADNGAKVISMSLGANLDCPSVLQDAANYAWSKGVVIVAAAGNANMDDAHTPANCPNVTPIGAVDETDTRGSFSNYGSAVPVAAPGVMILSTGLNNDYAWMTGTSMATPHAAGVAALVWASTYGTSNQAVVSRIFSTADRVSGTGIYWVYGRINAATAVGTSGAQPVPSPSPTPSPTPIATPSPTPSPSPTVPPVCAPRPAVVVRSTWISTGVMQVSVTAGAPSAAAAGNNRLQAIRFGAATNAVIEAGPQAAAGNFTRSLLPAAPDTFTFTVRRASAGAFTVPMTVVDSCGDWQTFVGAGAGTF